MSDDRAFVDRVARGLEPDPCSYRCSVVEGCPESTGYQADKLASGRMVRLTDAERTFCRAMSGKFTGSYSCTTHAPRHCRYCSERIPWWDGDTCDYCDRYTDETG